MDNLSDMVKSNIEKIKVESAEIIVTGTKEKPYYEIEYKEVGKDYYCVGYSSYDLNNVFDWKNECFEIVNQEVHNDICIFSRIHDWLRQRCAGNKHSCHGK